jgi:hypothetical protein
MYSYLPALAVNDSGEFEKGEFGGNEFDLLNYISGQTPGY